VFVSQYPAPPSRGMSNSAYAREVTGEVISNGEQPRPPLPLLAGRSPHLFLTKVQGLPLHKEV
jgi:hypothetical protein